MPMMTSHIFKCVDFIKTQKSRYLKNIFKKKKNSIITYQGLFYYNNSLVAEVTLEVKVYIYL